VGENRGKKYAKKKISEDSLIAVGEAQSWPHIFSNA